MSYNFLPYSQDQLLLMPPSLREWVSEESLAQFISDVVDRLDREGKLAAFYAERRADGWGRASYHPVMMVKVLLYGYAVGVRSSREIERALENDVSFRFLAANQVPNFRTIADFRSSHRESLDRLFVDLLELCAEAGLVKLGRVSLDGRKVRGSAALDRNRRRKELEREVARILEESEAKDREEDVRHGIEARGDELPPEMRNREKRLKELEEAIGRLKEEEEKAKAAQQQRIDARKQREEATGKKTAGRPLKPAEAVVDEKAQTNLTDAESRIMSTRRGWLQGYNGQAMVDCSSQVIVAQGLTQDQNDLQQLDPMLDRCEAQAGRLPDELLADAGYCSEANLALEDRRGTKLFIATTKEWKQRIALRENGDAPAPLPQEATAVQRMEHRLRTPEGRATYKQRSPTSEGVFGQMHERRLNHFLLRGLEKCSLEWSLFCSGHNLLKLWRASRVAVVS